MKGTLLEISDNAGADESSSSSRTIVAALCALLVAGLVIGGYLYLRKRHARQTLLAIQAEQTPAVPPKGPPKAQILVDDAIREGDQTLVAGTIKNISNENLIQLSVELELIKRKSGAPEKLWSRSSRRNLPSGGRSLLFADSLGRLCQRQTGCATIEFLCFPVSV